MASVLVLEKSPWPNEGFIQPVVSEESLLTLPLAFVGEILQLMGGTRVWPA
jgi:hypothetical protein